MTVENWKVQASYKYGKHMEHMLNVRADSPGELRELANAMCDVAPNLALLSDALSGNATVVETFPQSQVVDSSHSPQMSPGYAQTSNVVPFQGQYATSWIKSSEPALPAQPASGYTCNHGAMIYKTGVSDRGPWQGWFCVLGKNDPGRCQPKYPK